MVKVEAFAPSVVDMAAEEDAAICELALSSTVIRREMAYADRGEL